LNKPLGRRLLRPLFVLAKIGYSGAASSAPTQKIVQNLGIF
jgi:hypothetical protein